MRPNELAQKTIQEREHAWNKSLKKAGSTALSIGASIAGAGIASKVLPFLSEFISPELALKGISKVSPKLGDFLQRGMSQGLALNDGLQYLKSQIGGTGLYAGGKSEEEEQVQNIAPRGTPQFQGTHGQAPGSIRELIGSGQAMKAGQYQPQPQQPQPQQSQGAPGPGQQALMQVLQQINEKLG